MSAVLFATVLGWASDPSAVTELQDPPTVRREIARGVWVDWTDLAIEVTTRARGHGPQDAEAAEQQARREVDAAIRQAAARVPLTGELTVGAIGDDRVRPAVQSRLSRWEVTEGRYGSAGEVVLTAALSLQELLKPYTLAEARPGPAQAEHPPEWTGLVIDARGASVVPCWAPRLVTDDGQSLLVVRMWEDEAVNVAPLVYVSDPAHPAAARAGDHPLFVRAADASGGDVVLSGADLARFNEELSGARILGEGRVVVVVDP
jgi:hypothetical protein